MMGYRKLPEAQFPRAYSKVEAVLNPVGAKDLISWAAVIRMLEAWISLLNGSAYGFARKTLLYSINFSAEDKVGVHICHQTD